MLSEYTLEQSPILIVDDEPHNVGLLKRILRREGYTEISTTTDSTEVTALYEELQPDLILLDLNMPEMDGFAVMTALQAQFPNTDLNIIVVTALDGQSVRRNVLDAGAKDFITKPIDRTELLARIRNHLQTHVLHKQLERQNAELAKANETLGDLNQSNNYTFRNDKFYMTQIQQKPALLADLELVHLNLCHRMQPIAILQKISKF